MSTNGEITNEPAEPQSGGETASANGPQEASQPAGWFYCDRISCERKVPRHEARYNCQQCQDFDYCERCIPDAPLIHPGHTFVKIEAPEAPPKGDGGDDNPDETESDNLAEKPHCYSCAPVTKALPLLTPFFDPEKNPDASPKKQMRIRWPLRISGLIEATQRGCAFCSFFLHAFFRSSNLETHFYTEESPWYARPSEHDKERMELVEHCMGTLTKLKTDRFDFDVFPICSRKGAKPWDFDKLRFSLSDSNAKMHGKEDLKPGQVFHSAGVIATERYVFAAKDDPAAQVIASRPPNPSPASPEAINEIKTWLTDCDQHHGPSCLPSTPGSIPSRLIDISDPTTLRLYDTSPSSSSTTPRYAALSYCWGGPQPFQTTLSTLPTLQQGFPLTSLPPTLRDAVLLTQQLGIPYLWIDALCIVQDSAQDKFHQLAFMSDIYKHAYLTIIAARAGGAEEGFLADRADPQTGLWKALVPLAYNLPSEEAKSVGEAAKLPPREKGRFFLLEEPASMSSTVKDPVTRRAWCLQERVLSPRVVSYGRWPTWRCNRVVGSDGGFVKGEERGERRLTQGLVRPPVEGKNGGMDHFRTAQLLATWRDMVQDYTRRKLSLPTDRLPAIAGIAREIGRLTRMEYLAGLWRENILQELMWYARTQEWRTRPAHSDEFPLAPTWSWASVEAPILCDAVTEDATPLARVLRCIVRGIEGKSTYDVVAGGEVEIRGPFTELRREDVVELLQQQNYSPAPPISNDVQEWYTQMLESFATRPENPPPIDDVEAALPDRVFGLMLFERDWTDDRWDKGRPKVMVTCYFGLLLREIKEGRYERIGAFYNDTSDFLSQGVRPWEESTVVLV